jgi:hypothetical protein
MDKLTFKIEIDPKIQKNINNEKKDTLRYLLNAQKKGNSSEDIYLGPCKVCNAVCQYQRYANFFMCLSCGTTTRPFSKIK